MQPNTMDLFNFSKEINSHQIHVWSINVSNVPENFQNSYYGLLSPNERSRVSKLRFLKDQRTFIIARGVLKKLSGYYLNIDPKMVDFEYEKFGKPRYRNNSPIKFNVSHSGNLILIGFTKDYELGVDIEYIKEDFNMMEIARNFFSKQEIRSLERLPTKEKPIGFYRCWTRKEAIIKAIGTGLSFPLDSFAVSLDHDLNALLQTTTWNPSEKKNWTLHSFRPNKKYMAAIAIKTKKSSYQLFDWNKNICNT